MSCYKKKKKGKQDTGQEKEYFASTHPLSQRMQTSCKGSGSKGFAGSEVLGMTTQLCHHSAESSHRKCTNRQAWLCSKKRHLQKSAAGLMWASGCPLLTPGLCHHQKPHPRTTGMSSLLHSLPDAL